jgi:choloylglycine hydrolase
MEQFFRKLNRSCFSSVVIAALAAVSLWSHGVAYACTGIALTAGDGAVVFGRTLEWGAFDLKSRLVVVPRGYEFTSKTPDGNTGMRWQGQYGVVGLDALEKDHLVEGMNEQGLSAGAFYLPGFTQYQPYEWARKNQSLGPLDVVQYILTQFATVAEVRAALQQVDVVPVSEPALGFPPPLHFILTEPGGKSIVIEYLQGKLSVFDSPLRVITNAPSYDWHMTNLRNFVNLSATALPGLKMEELDFAPLGSGSGLIGLPGDFTPPSRFVRAVAFSQTARPTLDGPETVYEVLRILDNFNLGLGSAEGSDLNNAATTGMRSATVWTTVSDTRNRVLYYHTQHNRRLRSVDLKKIDFSRSTGDLRRYPLDKSKSQDVEEITPG